MREIRQVPDTSKQEQEPGHLHLRIPPESDPYMTRSEVDGLITDRLMQFHKALVERGQIPPIRPKTKDD